MLRTIIPEEIRIIEYQGQLISQAEAARHERRYLSRGRIWIVNIDDRWRRDAPASAGAGGVSSVGLARGERDNFLRVGAASASG